MKRASLLARVLFFAVLSGALGAGLTDCRSGTEPLPEGLLISMAVFEKNEDAKPVPGPATLGILRRDADGWNYRTIEDPDSNVFHKAMVYEPEPGRPGILTLGGTRAILKLHRPGKDPEVLWEKDFGGRFSRMRDAEAADLYGDGRMALAVATHDQGVVAIVRPGLEGGWEVKELNHEPETIVHEIEIGDLNGDGTLEIYATPSSRNLLDGTPQPGTVTRYVPATGEGPTVVADLDDRHAKEILVDDIDGDGRDELYVVVEAVSGGTVEIRRYEADTDPGAGVIIAELADKLCRFLTSGDPDGDGQKEIVAAGQWSGVWLIEPASGPGKTWPMTLIDEDSGGFEHAAILTDLDGNGVEELYVASDDDGEIRRYVWKDGKPVREVIHKHEEDFNGFTWNLMPVPVELMP